MIESFLASRLKLDRARSHLTELDNACSSYFDRNPCAIVEEDFFKEPSLGALAFISRIREKPPLNISMIIGDIVHNLRTSLDLLACDLVRIAGKNSNAVYFPFCENPADLKATIKKRNIGKAGGDIVQLIETIQPYKGGNSILRSIHDLDVADKHKTILLTIAATSFPLSDFLKTPIVTPSGDGRWDTIVADGHMVIGLPAYLSPPLGTELPSRFFLCFADGDAFIKGRAILEFLHQAFDVVNGIVEACISLRPGARFPIVETS